MPCEERESALPAQGMHMECSVATFRQVGCVEGRGTGHLNIYSIGSKLSAEVSELIAWCGLVVSHMMPHDAVP